MDHEYVSAPAIAVDAVLPIDSPQTALGAVIVQSGLAVMGIALVHVLEHPDLVTVTVRVVVPDEPAVKVTV